MLFCDQQIRPTSKRECHVEITALLHIGSKVLKYTVMLQILDGSQDRQAFLIQMDILPQSGKMQQSGGKRYITIFAALHPANPFTGYHPPTSVSVFSARLVGYTALLPELSFPTENQSWTFLNESIASRILHHREPTPDIGHTFRENFYNFPGQAFASVIGCITTPKTCILTSVLFCILLGFMILAARIKFQRQHDLTRHQHQQYWDLLMDEPVELVTVSSVQGAAFSCSVSSHISSLPSSLPPGRLRMASGPVVRRLVYEDSVLEPDVDDECDQYAGKLPLSSTPRSGQAIVPRMKARHSESVAPSKAASTGRREDISIGILAEVRSTIHVGWTRDALGRLARVGGRDPDDNLSMGSQSYTAGSGSGSTGSFSGSRSGDSPFIQSAYHIDPHGADIAEQHE